MNRSFVPIVAITFVFTVILASQLSAAPKAVHMKQTIPLPTSTGLPIQEIPGIIQRVSIATGGTQASNQSFRPAMSADGRYVTFTSYASNLVPGDTNGVGDVFIHDRQNGITTRVSVASDGAQGYGHSRYSAISADGRYITFVSHARNLVPGDTYNYPQKLDHMLKCR